MYKIIVTTWSTSQIFNLLCVNNVLCLINVESCWKFLINLFVEYKVFPVGRVNTKVVLSSFSQAGQASTYEGRKRKALLTKDTEVRGLIPSPGSVDRACFSCVVYCYLEKAIGRSHAVTMNGHSFVFYINTSNRITSLVSFNYICIKRKCLHESYLLINPSLF